MKRLRITVDGKAYEVDVEVLEENGGALPASPSVPARPAAAAAEISAPSAPSAPRPAPGAGAAGDVTSPLAAVVISIDVQPGQAVKMGERLITLEAMKMNTLINAPHDGTVGAIHVKPTDAVEEGQVMLTLN